MKKLILLKLLVLSLILFSGEKIICQENIKKDIKVFQIPHKTPWEKWMWIHRSITYLIIKERKATYDTTYIKSYSKRLTLIIPVSARFMHFDILAPRSGKFLQYAPNYRYDVGFGVSSRWATFITNTGIVFFNGNNNERGVTKHNDFQLNLYGKHYTSDIIYQNYRGFYVANTKDFQYEGSGPFEVRSDVKATLFVNSTYYIFNSKKFSYRNSFAFTESQLKSAGSFLLGPYYSLFGVKADSNIISRQFSQYFDTLDIIEGSVQTVGLSAGYIHTFVKEKAYLTLSMVPGLGLDQVSYERSDKSTFRSSYNPGAKVNFRVGLGYDTGTFFIGAMGVYDYFYNFNGRSNTFNFSTGKAMAYIGYRFKYQKAEKKILRKLGLIDYPGDPRN
ncbi:MAG TPA: DUF4421 family protein [Bacteroidia bacterium]|jgi:hypothetical protein